MSSDNEISTRDAAIEARATMNAHLTDCAAYRLRLADELKTMKRDIGEDTTCIKSDIADIRLDLKRQTKAITLITGGIVALSRAPDLITFFHRALTAGGN
jgi:hypothetical protein